MKSLLAAFLALTLFPAVAAAIDDAPPANDAISGREIFQRVIDNKLNTSYLEHRMLSTDPGGSVQTLTFWSRFKDLRTPETAPPGTVISKTVMKFTDPFDKRDTAYLFIEKRGTEDEGFHYSRRRTRVTRIAPAKESIFGTDFSLDDLAVVRHIEDATYERLPDEEVQGKIVWVVDVAHKPETDPAYARSMLYVDKERNVPLRTRHWDEAGVEGRSLIASPFWARTCPLASRIMAPATSEAPPAEIAPSRSWVSSGLSSVRTPYLLL